MSNSIQTIIQQATRQLTPRNDTPRLDAETLLADLLNKDRSYLIAHRDEALSNEQQQAFQQRIQRLANGEPHAYILGYRDFWSLRLRVNPGTLIPRADTEIVVETALKLLSDTSDQDTPIKVADLGTGSGAIALSIASERPNIQLLATDISQAALDTAQQSASDHQIRNCQFLQHDWRTQTELPGAPHDLIVSNPPYIASNDPHLQQGDLPSEPLQALASGLDGLDDIRMISQQARQWLKPEGWLILEHGYNQASEVQRLLSEQGYQNITTVHDLAGNPRCTQAQMAYNMPWI